MAGVPLCDGIGTLPSRASGPRIRHLRVAGLPVSVLLPTGYARSERRYPVLYLLHGGTDGVNHFLANTDLRKATKALPRTQQYIVVTPYGGYAGFYRDWVDGSHRFQSKHIERVIPTIDRTFRTKRDRQFRAVAGASMGGFGAMHYALTHQRLFSAVGTFSGSLDIQAPDSSAVILAATSVQRICVDGAPPAQVQPAGWLGDPVTRSDRWTAVNPAANAPSARGLHIALSDTSGVPCNREDANDPTAAAIEQIAHRGTQSMDRALTAAGIPHTYRTAPCGVHTTPYFNTQVVRYVRTIGRVFASRLTGGAAPADRTAR